MCDSLGMSKITRRSQITVLRDIMELLDSPIVVTHIINKSNISYRQLSFYLNFLKLGRLVTKIDMHYTLTEEGRAFRCALRLGVRKDE